MQANLDVDQSALEAVEQWLVLIDAGDCKQSLNRAAPLFRSGFQTATSFRRGVSEHEWESFLARLQSQLGKAVLRDLKAVRRGEESPGEPATEHLLLEYDTHFERNGHAVETVTLTSDPDGLWRVSGYHIVLGSPSRSWAA